MRCLDVSRTKQSNCGWAGPCQFCVHSRHSAVRRRPSSSLASNHVTHWAGGKPKRARIKRSAVFRPQICKALPNGADGEGAVQRRTGTAMPAICESRGEASAPNSPLNVACMLLESTLLPDDWPSMEKSVSTESDLPHTSERHGNSSLTTVPMRG